MLRRGEREDRKGRREEKEGREKRKEGKVGRDWRKEYSSPKSTKRRTATGNQFSLEMYVN